jgi:hypothetical protein
MELGRDSFSSKKKSFIADWSAVNTRPELPLGFYLIHQYQFVTSGPEH